MNRQRILWFQDSAKLRTDPKDWGRLDVLTMRLVASAGHPEFEHVIVDLLSHLKVLENELRRRTFSSVIDLSGQMRSHLERMLPGTLVSDDLHLSRIRVVSSPRLDGIGHFVSLGSAQIREMRDRVDLSRPLFIDDVGWSGRTMIDAAGLLGASMQDSTFGFITANVGTFGIDKPGGARLLEEAGAEVVAGSAVQTPQDDGFHLLDFFDHPALGRREMFDTIIHLQDLRERLAICDEGSKKSIEREIKDVLLERREGLFPHSIDTQGMKVLQSEGRVIAQNGLNKNSFFDRNIPNWLMPSFSRRLSSEMLRRNRTEICDTIHELQQITRDKEASAETRRDFPAETFWPKRER